MGELIDKSEMIKFLSKKVDEEGLVDLTQWLKENAHKDYNHSGVAQSIAALMEADGIAIANFYNNEWHLKKANSLTRQLSESTIQTNNYSRRSNVILVIVFSITLILSFITMYISILNYRIDVKKMKMQEQLENLQQQIQSQKK